MVPSGVLVALLKIFIRGSAARNSDEVAKRLVHKASAAIDSISHYVIRHSIDDLPKEHKTLGVCEEWKFDEACPQSNR